MRLLFLRRQHHGEFAETIDDWASALRGLECFVCIEDAGDWIPNEISADVDRRVAQRLKELGKDYDYVQAFGYRAAWACAETWGDREAWGFTAWDHPRTTHASFLKRLGMASLKHTVSRSVANVLRGAGLSDVEVIYPGIETPTLHRPVEAVREHLKLPPDGLLIGAAYGDRIATATHEDDGTDLLFELWPEIASEYGLVVAGEGATVQVVAGVTEVGPIPRVEELIAACDLWVVPGRRLGFSRKMLQAMALGRPVLARAQGGLQEIVAEDVSGFLFFDDDSLANRIKSVMEMSLTREAISNAARVRAEEVFDLRQSAASLKEAIRRITG